MTAALALGLAAGAAAAQETKPAPPGGAPDRVIAALIEAHNRERSKEGLPPLKSNAELERAARGQARDMARRDKMSHTGGDGSSPSDRIKATGYRYRGIGENVAEGQKTPEEAVKVWMDSPPHRKNILGDFSEIGAAVAESADGTPYWCVDFGLPMPQLDPDAAVEALVEAHNRERKEADLKPLTVSKALAGAAQAQARALARAGSARAKDGQGPFRQLEESGYRFLKAAENVAAGTPTADETMKQWMGSRAQKRNVLGAFREIGAGYATAEDGTPYWVVLYAQPADR